MPAIQGISKSLDRKKVVMIPLHITNYYNYADIPQHVRETEPQPMIMQNQVVSNNVKYIFPPHHPRN